MSNIPTNAPPDLKYNVFVPNFKQIKEIATATGLDEGSLSAVVLGLQTLNVVFAQIVPPEQTGAKEDNGTTNTGTPSAEDLAASLSAIGAEFKNK
jgi:hypothetical protein